MTWPQTGLGRELREHAGYQTADTPEHMCAVKLWTFTSRENNITKGMKGKKKNKQPTKNQTTLPYTDRENMGRNNVMAGHYQ